MDRPDGGYRRLLGRSDVRRIAVAMLLSRMAGQAFSVALVLLALLDFHSPSFAGLTTLVSIVPGLLTSPIAGALLDRNAKSRLVTLDYVVAAVSTASIGLLGVVHLLQPWLLIVIAGLNSITNPLSQTGMRAALPLILPRSLWDRANSVDSATANAAATAGPLAAGAAIAIAGPHATMCAIALLWTASAVLILPVGMGSPARSEHHILRDALSGLRYMASNPTLRGIAISVSVLNLGWGAVIIGLPFIVLSQLFAGPAAVGALWAASSVAGLVTGLVIGRTSTAGVEKRMYAFGLGATALAISLLALAHSLWVAALAMLMAGAATSAINLPAWAMRQRRTDPALFGRALSVSMACNVIGVPVGAAIGGPLVHWSTTGTLLLAACCALAGMALAVWLIPGDGDSAHDDPIAVAAARA